MWIIAGTLYPEILLVIAGPLGSPVEGYPGGPVVTPACPLIIWEMVVEAAAQVK